MRFLGNIEAKMDAKGRAFLPAVFRKILQTASSNGTAYADQSLRLVLRKDVFQPCLVLYPESVWNEQMDALRQRLNRWNKQHQQVFRQFVSEVEVLTLDGNGRFLVPKRYLRMVLRKDVFQPCLVLYPESVWNEQMDALRQRLNRWNKQHQQVFRQYVSEVEIVTLDGNGRFLVPKRYLRMADIDQDVKFVGMGDTIEIWSNAKAEQSQMNPEEFGKALEELMEDTLVEN